MDEQKPFNQQHHSHRHLEQVGNQLQFAQSLLPSSDHEHQMKAFDPYPAQLSSTGRTNPFFNISGLTADIHGSNSQSMSPLICSGDLSRSAQPGIVQYSNYPAVIATDPSLQSLQARSKPVVTAAINPAASSAFFAMANDHRLSRTADNHHLHHHHHHLLLHHLQESSDQARGEPSNKNSMASRYTAFHHNPTRDAADHMDMPLPDSHCSILSDRMASSDHVAASAERKNVHNAMSFNGGPSSSSSSSRYGYGNMICAGNSSSDSLMIPRHNGNGMSSLYQNDHGGKRDGRRSDYMMAIPSPLNGSAEINTVSSGSNYAMIVSSQGSNYRANPSHGELKDHHQMNYLAGFHGSSQRPPPASSDGYGYGDGDGGGSGSHYTRDLSLSLSAQKTSHQLQANESHDQICPNLHDNLRTNNADSAVSAHHHHHHHHHRHQAPLSVMMMQQQKTRYMEEESWSIIQSSVYLKATQQILREMAVRLSHKSGGHGSYQEAQKLSNHNNTVVMETAAYAGAGEKIKGMEIQLATTSDQKETEQENDGGGGDGDTKKQSQDLVARNPRFTQETAAVAKLEEVRINHEAHTYHRSDPPDSSLMTVIQRPSIPANSAAAMAPVRAANTIAGISSSDRSQIQRKLSIMLDELDKKYRMFEEEMRVVMMLFEGAANKCDDDKDNNNKSMAMVMAGVAPYKDMAAKAVETRFRVLRESITHQACALMITTNLGPSAGSGSKLIHGGEAGHHSSTNTNFLNASHWNDVSSMDPGNSRSRRMRLLDHQFRQQRAQAQAQAQAQQQHQSGSLFHSQPWRPQRGLPERSVSLLRAWLFDHFLHPYPKDTEKLLLARQTGLTRNQVSNWFINARVRLWKPLVEEMYQEEKKMPQVWQGDDASCTLGNSAGTSSNPHLQQESISRGHYDFTRNESEKHAGVPSKFGSQLMEMQELVSMQGGAINMEASKFLKNSLVPSRHEYVEGYRDDANDLSHHHHQQFVSANRQSETTITIAGRVLEGDQQCGSTHTWPFIQHQSILPLDGHQGQHYGTDNAALMRFGSGAGGVTLTLGLQQHSNTSLSAAMGCDVDDIDPHVNEIPMPFRM